MYIIAIFVSYFCLVDFKPCSTCTYNKCINSQSYTARTVTSIRFKQLLTTDEWKFSVQLQSVHLYSWWSTFGFSLFHDYCQSRRVVRKIVFNNIDIKPLRQMNISFFNLQYIQLATIPRIYLLILLTSAGILSKWILKPLSLSVWNSTSFPSIFATTLLRPSAFSVMPVYSRAITLLQCYFLWAKEY